LGLLVFIRPNSPWVINLSFLLFGLFLPDTQTLAPSRPLPLAPFPPSHLRRHSESMEVERAAAATAAGGSSAEMAVDHATGPAAVEKPRFDALMPSEMSGGKPQFRKVPVPQHRFAPLKRCWMEIYTPVYEHMKVDIRMNIKVRDHPASIFPHFVLYLSTKASLKS